MWWFKTCSLHPPWNGLKRQPSLKMLYLRTWSFQEKQCSDRGLAPWVHQERNIQDSPATPRTLCQAVSLMLCLHPKQKACLLAMWLSRIVDLRTLFFAHLFQTTFSKSKLNWIAFGGVTEFEPALDFGVLWDNYHEFTCAPFSLFVSWNWLATLYSPHLLPGEVEAIPKVYRELKWNIFIVQNNWSPYIR